MTINQLIGPFIKFLKTHGRSEATIVAYKKDIEQLATFLSDKEIRVVTAKDINSFIKFITIEKGFTNKTASRKINSTKTFFRFALENKYIKEDPAAFVDHPDIENRPPKILSRIEYKAIRDTARKNIRIYTMIELLLQTGIRIGEISRLKLEDVKLDANPPKIIIHAYESSPLRFVDLNSAAKEALESYLPKRRVVKNDEGYLFNTRTGKNVLVRNIRTAINRVFRRAGVEGIRVNDLRNTFICHQIENGMKLEKIAEMVGHRRISSTEKYLEITQRKTPGRSTNAIPL